MAQSLDCKAFVFGGMADLMAYVETPAGQRAIDGAKALHEAHEARIAEVLRTYSTARLYGCLCSHHRVNSLAELCRVVSAERALALKNEKDRVNGQFLPQILYLLSEDERKELVSLLG